MKYIQDILKELEKPQKEVFSNVDNSPRERQLSLTLIILNLAS